jgi:hypothetical protein
MCRTRWPERRGFEPLKSVNHLIGTTISAHCNRSDTMKTERAGPSPPHASTSGCCRDYRRRHFGYGRRSSIRGAWPR